jgi:hypothetical protein
MTQVNLKSILIGGFLIPPFVQLAQMRFGCAQVMATAMNSCMHLVQDACMSNANPKIVICSRCTTCNALALLACLPFRQSSKPCAICSFYTSYSGSLPGP